jgi:hypothetical protein
MQKIPLELAGAGMVLEKPILRDNGLVLVAEGTVLSEALIGRLRTMEVEFVVVQGRPVDLDGAGEQSLPAQRLARLDHLFRSHGDEWMLKVKTFLRNHFQARAARDASGLKAARPEEGGK